MAVGNSTDSALRDRYLQTLGVVQYTPRDLCDTEVVDQPVAEVQEPQVAYAPSQIQSVLEEIAVDNKPAQRPLPKSTGASVQDKHLALTFALWQLSDDFLIATAVEDKLPDSQQTKLLANLLLAMDKNAPTVPQFEAVKWPPHSHIKGSETEAKEFLSTLMDTRMAAKSVKTLLLLGESTAQWLISSQQDISLDKGIYPLSDTATALVIPSLTEMLADPDCKRVAWGTICRYLSCNSIQ